MNPRVRTPAEYIAYDSTRVDTSEFPGAITTKYTSPEQDSAFARALRLRISSSARFAESVRAANAQIRMALIQRETTPWDVAMRNMDVPKEFLTPDPREVTQYALNIQRSMHVPGVLLWPMGTGDMQVPLSEIAAFFGISEDVSPVLRYSIAEHSEVLVLIYSPAAILVNTLFSGIQPPGSYQITWNGRDDNGTTVSRGDYIAEIRLSNERILRKRILWPPK